MAEEGWRGGGDAGAAAGAGGKAALFIPLIKGLSTLSARRRETNLQVDTL